MIRCDFSERKESVVEEICAAEFIPERDRLHLAYWYLQGWESESDIHKLIDMYRRKAGA